MSTHNNTNSTNTNPDDYSNTPVNSSFQPIIPPSGIAQGSKLSSLLFILTYNDIHKHVRHSEILMYADDVKIFKTIQSENDCYQLQEDLDSLTRWLATIGLNFHPKKSFVMAYTVKRKRPASPHIYKINNVNLQYVDQYKDLGVTFESDLNFNIHRYEVETKGFQRLGMVHRYTKPVHDIDVIQILYQALVRSVLEYGSVLWLPHTKSGAKSLERIQARFVRNLFFKENQFYPLYPCYIEYALLSEHLGIETLESRRQNEQIKLLKNIINGNISSSYLLDKIQINVPDMRLRTLHNDITFHIQNTRDVHLKKSPIVAAMSAYNSLEIKPNITT